MRGAIAGARLAWHVLIAVLKLGLLARHWSAARRHREIAHWSQKVFGLLGVRLAVRGALPSGNVAQLYAGNHISWLDIFALLSTADLRFVAKAEVRRWPVMGWLASQLGTHFIARQRRADAYAAATAASALLSAGRNVCIFPEGSTTDGSHLQPFRGALFEAASQSRARIQPVAIRYVDRAGRRADAAAFVGETSLIGSLRSLLRHRDITCEVTFLSQIESAGCCRRELARAAERAIAHELGLEVKMPAVAPAAPMANAAVRLVPA